MAESPMAAQEQSSSVISSMVGTVNSAQKLSPQARTPSASRPESASLLKLATTNSRPGSAVARANFHALSGSRPNSASKAKNTLGTRSEDVESRLLDVRVGLEIEIDFGGLGEWYPGVVRRDREDGTFDVEYDYGDIETHVPLDRMRTRMLRSPRQYSDIGIDLSPKGSVSGSRTGHHNLMLGDNDSVNIDMDQDLHSIASNDASLMSPPNGCNLLDRGGSLRGSAKLNVPILFPVGTAVEANYRGQGNWLFGKISNVRGITSTWFYDIDYDNGDIETHVEVDFIRFKGDLSPLQTASPLEVSAKGGYIDDGKATRDVAAAAAITTTTEAAATEAPEASAVILAPDFLVGARVEANYLNRGKFHAGTVSKVRTSQEFTTYDINYDGGEIEMHIKSNRIRSAAGDAKRASSEAVNNYVQEMLETAIVNRSRPTSATSTAGRSVLTSAPAEAATSYIKDMIGAALTNCSRPSSANPSAETTTTAAAAAPAAVPVSIPVQPREVVSEEMAVVTVYVHDVLDGASSANPFANAAGSFTAPPMLSGLSDYIVLVEEQTSGEEELLAVGTRVTVDYMGRGKHYPGNVTRVRRGSNAATYDISYDDGEIEMRVESKQIRVTVENEEKPEQAKELSSSPAINTAKEAAIVVEASPLVPPSPSSSSALAYSSRMQEFAVPRASLLALLEAATPSAVAGTEELFQVHDKVEVNYRGRGRYYPGRIRCDRGNGSYDINYDDGETELRVEAALIKLIDRHRPTITTTKPVEPTKPTETSMAAEEPVRLLVKLEEGDEVEVNYRGKGKYYPGKIKRVYQDNNSFDIEYDDGESESRVKAYFIVKLDKDPGDGREKRQQVALSPHELGIVKVGDQVLVQTHIRDAFREVTITAVNPADGTFNIDLAYYSHHVKEDECNIPAYRLFVLVKAAEPLEVGSFVMADYHGRGKFYPGHIKTAAVATATDYCSYYDVLYDEEEEELHVPAHRIRVPKPLAAKPSSSSSSSSSSSPSFAVGDRVEVRPYNSEDYLTGGIVAVEANGSYSILYDHNGSEEKNVLPDFVRAISSSSSSSTSSSSSNLLVDIAKDDRIEVDDKHFKANGLRRRGVVLRVNGDNSIDVKYWGNEKEMHVAPHRVVKIGPNGIKQPLTATTAQEEEEENALAADLLFLPPAPPAASLAAGDNVQVEYYRRGKFIAAIVECDHGDGTYDVVAQFHSRVMSRVRADRIRAMCFPSAGTILAVNQRIEVSHQGYRSSSFGRILGLKGNDWYSVAYDDGSREEVSCDHIRVMSSPCQHRLLAARPRFEIGQRVRCLYNENEDEEPQDLPAVVVKRYSADDSYDIIFGHEISVAKHVFSDALRPVPPSLEPAAQMLVELKAGDIVQAFYLQQHQQQYPQQQQQQQQPQQQQQILLLPGMVERVRSSEESKEAGSNSAATFDIVFDAECIETYVQPYYIIKVLGNGQNQVVAMKPGLPAFTNGDRIELMANGMEHFSAGTVDFAYGHGLYVISLDNGEQRTAGADELRWPTMLKASAQESLQRRREAVQALQATQAQQRMKLQTVLNKVAGWKETMQQQQLSQTSQIDKANNLLAEMKRIQEQES